MFRFASLFLVVHSWLIDKKIFLLQKLSMKKRCTLIIWLQALNQMERSHSSGIRQLELRTKYSIVSIRLLKLVTEIKSVVLRPESWCWLRTVTFRSFILSCRVWLMTRFYLTALIQCARSRRDFQNIPLLEPLWHACTCSFIMFLNRVFVVSLRF